MEVAGLEAAEAGTSSPAQVRRALWLYALLVLLVTAASWTIYTRNPVFDTRPLYRQDEQFRDLLYYVFKTAHLYHQSAALGRGFPVFNYPAPGAFVFKTLLYTFPGYPVQTYLAFLLVCTSEFALLAWAAARAGPALRLATGAAIATTAYFGYPLWFTADRGNTEGVVWALTGAGLCFLLRGRNRTAAVLLGVASSIKPFSMLFLLLMLRRGRYKEALLAPVTAGVLILAALVALGPNPWKAYQDLQPGMTYYMDHYVENLMPVQEARFEHSVLDGMKSAALTVEMGGVHPIEAITEVPKLMQEPGGWHVVRPLVRVYPFVLIAGVGLVFAVFYRMPAINQLTALAVVATLSPPVSGDYTLLQLYVPFGALLIFLVREVAAGKASFPNASMLLLATIYALLFAPLTFLHIYSGDAKLLLLLALLAVAARSPMRSAYFGDTAQVGA